MLTLNPKSQTLILYSHMDPLGKDCGLNGSSDFQQDQWEVTRLQHGQDLRDLWVSQI